MKRLTVKQQNFVAEYVSNGGNASQAALEAYDCDYAVARVIGSQNLTKVHIRDSIAELTLSLSEGYPAPYSAVAWPPHGCCSAKSASLPAANKAVLMQWQLGQGGWEVGARAVRGDGRFTGHGP